MEMVGEAGFGRSFRALTGTVARSDMMNDRCGRADKHKKRANRDQKKNMHQGKDIKRSHVVHPYSLGGAGKLWR
jgi:hypothetical protein